MTTEENKTPASENTCPCQSGGFVGSEIIAADDYYSDEEKAELRAEGLSWDFALDICTGCNSIIGMLG